MACCLMAPSYYLNQCSLIIGIMISSSDIHLRAISQEISQPSIRAGVNFGIGIGIDTNSNSNSRNWNWIKGIGIGIDREELKELIQFLFLIVNSFWFFAMFLAKSLNQFDLKSFWIQLTRISLDTYIILYDIYQLNGFCMAVIDFISKLHVMDFALENMTQRSFFHQIWPRN